MGFRCRLWELRGDWKWHFQCWGLQSNWMADGICHMCAASKSKAPLYHDFTATPSWLSTVRTHEDFVLQQLPRTRCFNAMMHTIGFHYRMLRWCAMHTLHLGCGLHANGSAFHELLLHDHFPGTSEQSRFVAAFALFKNWCKASDISCSQSAFKPYMLVAKGEEFCYLQTKVSCRVFGHICASSL